MINYCYLLLFVKTVSARSIEGSDRYLSEITSYIGDQVTSKTDEINWQFQ